MFVVIKTTKEFSMNKRVISGIVANKCFWGKISCVLLILSLFISCRTTMTVSPDNRDQVLAGLEVSIQRSIVASEIGPVFVITGATLNHVLMGAGQFGLGIAANYFVVLSHQAGQLVQEGIPSVTTNPITGFMQITPTTTTAEQHTITVAYTNDGNIHGRFSTNDASALLDGHTINFMSEGAQRAMNVAVYTSLAMVLLAAVLSLVVVLL